MGGQCDSREARESRLRAGDMHGMPDAAGGATGMQAENICFLSPAPGASCD